MEPSNAVHVDDARRSTVVAAAAVALLAVPFVVMIVVQWRPRWYPLLDQAMIELLVRDVATSNSPTTGLVGRFLVDGAQASHPGPLSWFVLWPWHRLLGGSSFGLVVGTVVTNLLAVGVLVWMIARRRRLELVLVVTLAVVVVARGYGIIVLSEVWNPHLPVLWWLVVVFGTWSVVVGDRAMLPIVVFAGSLCAQTHISYAGPVGSLLALALGAMVVDAVRTPASRRHDLTWLAVGLALAVVLWLPPLYDELTNDPGNLSLLWQYFTSGQQTIGWRAAGDVLMQHLNPWRLATGELWGDRQSPVAGVPSGSIVPGAVVLGCWVLAAIASMRLGDRLLRRFHLVTGVTVLSAFISASRIVPPVWYWVVMFMWGITVVVLVAIGWTAAVLVGRLSTREELRPRRAALRGALVTAIVATTMVFVVETIDGPRLQDHPQSQSLGRLLTPTIEALHDGVAAGGGDSGRYRVLWNDPAGFGLQGYGLLNELERNGFDVAADPFRAPQVRPHRVDTEGFTADIQLAGGVFIDRALAQPGAVQVAYDDPRSDAERAEFDRLHDEVVALLVASGRDETVAQVDENLGVIPFLTDLDPAVIERAERMLEIGVPMAVIVTNRAT